MQYIEYNKNGKDFQYSLLFGQKLSSVKYHEELIYTENTAMLWEMIVWMILSKKVHTNMGPILNAYGVMGIF